MLTTNEHGFSTLIFLYLFFKNQNCIPSAMNNIKLVLKTEGRLIFNNICTVEWDSTDAQCNETTKILMEKVKNYDLDD